MQMKDTTLRYKLYEAALESGITTDQYQTLMNEGVLDWIKSALASVDAGKEMAGDLKNMFANKKNQVLYKQATETIKKTVEDLFKAGASAGVDKDALRDWLIKGIESVTRDAATSAPASEKTASKSELKPGETLTPENPKSVVPALAAAAASAVGQDVDKAKEQAEEKNVDVPKATKVLANAIAKSSGAPTDLSYKVIDWLLKNNHMVAEHNISRLSANELLKDIKKTLTAFSAASKNMSGNFVLSERWSKLAGLVCEEDKKSAEQAKKRFGNLLDDVQKALGTKDEDEESIMNILITLDDLDTIEVKK